MYLNNYKLNRKVETEILKLDYSFNYWIEMLFEKTIRVFEWQGLPFPQKEIETRLILDGFCGFVKDGLRGLMVASGGMSGATQYVDEFVNFTYAAATAQGGTKRIDKECVIVDNTSLRNNLYPMICRYASLLAHADISIKCSLVNLRETQTYASEDSTTADSIRAYHSKAYNGDMDVIVDSSIVGNIQNLNSNLSNSGVMDSIDARNEILRSFFNEIGIRYNRDKKERMIESEVASDDQLLLFNISDMLACRKKASEKINSLFNLKTSVNLSKEFDLIGGNDDES